MTYQEFKSKIHSLIPGGAHTYSKGDDQFPENAPTGIVKGKGAWLWDIEGHNFLDCSMGLGSVTLGHAFDELNETVINEISNGVNFQRPSINELKAAEAFLELLPGQDMIKFAKNGSAVTTAAVKLARAFTGRDLVAFPGDHPFYSYDDWFIGKTHCNKGVPTAIQDLSVTFKSCSIESLKELFSTYPGKIACVIMEPEKNTCGSLCSCSLSVGDYLKEAIEICHQNGALFILDEMVTGFKVDFPGACTKYNINPDMITWGKGIANGFSCSALTGKREVMQLGGILQEGQEKVFLISTTHGAETHALAALTKVISLYKKYNVIEKIHAKGQFVINETRKMINEKGLNSYVEVANSSWTPIWLFHSAEQKNSLLYKTYFMQEMINNNILFQGALVPSLSHNDNEINFFLLGFSNALDKYKQVLDEASIERELIGKPIRPVFRKFI